MAATGRRKTITSTAIGAALGAAVTVTVYEGRVLLAGTGGAVEVAPGELARLSGPGAVPEKQARGVAATPPAGGAAAAPIPRQEVPKFVPSPAPPAGRGAYGPKKALTLAELPLPYRAVVEQIAQGRQVQRLVIQDQTWNGEPRLEVELELDGMEHELKLDERGRILQSEVKLRPEDLPAPVTAAVKAAFPGATIFEAEWQQHRYEPGSFELDLRHGGAHVQVNVADDGRIVSKRAR